MRTNPMKPSVLLLAIAGLALVAPAADGQGPRAGATARPPVVPVEPIDTAATAALDRMAGYLRTLDSFQISGDLITEEVLEDGQKIQEAKEVDLVADRPGRLRLQVTNDRQQRLLLYDGKTFTVSAPRLKYYAQAPAPATIAELADVLEERFDLELPLVDLFRWGGTGSDFKALTGARVVGPSQIEGVTCMHYAFRQDGLDWQIWIQRGDFPLPRKIVLTTTTDEARPQHMAVYNWNLAPSFNDDAFAFVPPKEFKRISFKEAQLAQASTPATED
jgi:hypothetical protein